MSNKLSWSITCLALVAMGVMYWSQDKGYNEGDHVFRPVQPMTSHNQELQDRERVELSETTALRRDQMVRSISRNSPTTATGSCTTCTP
jgi:hypothetical protein